MKLESEGRPAVADARADDVHAAVNELALPAHSFLILSRTRTSYVQVAIQPGERFVIEYREGGARNFRSARADFSRDEIARLLESYLEGGEAWRAGLVWQPAGGTRPSDAWDNVSTVCWFVAVVTFVVVAFSFGSSGSPGASTTDPMVQIETGALFLFISSVIDVRRFKESGPLKK